MIMPAQAKLKVLPDARAIGVAEEVREEIGAIIEEERKMIDRGRGMLPLSEVIHIVEKGIILPFVRSVGDPLPLRREELVVHLKGLEYFNFPGPSIDAPPRKKGERDPFATYDKQTTHLIERLSMLIRNPYRQLAGGCYALHFERKVGHFAERIDSSRDWTSSASPNARPCMKVGRTTTSWKEVKPYKPYEIDSEGD